MKRMNRLDCLFDVKYPTTLVFGHQTKDPRGVPFVTSRGKNNGIAGRVAAIPGAELFPAGSITVPLKGTVMCAHLQPEPFYCAHQIAVLVPLKEMSTSERLYYVQALRLNKFRYSYGRQADRTLRDILVPDLDEIPVFVRSVDVEPFEGADLAATPDLSPPELDTEKWPFFKLVDLFDIQKGKRLTKDQMSPGNTPFIGAIDNNNGLSARIGQKPLHPGGTITVNYNGTVAEAFYQATPFRCSDDVNVLYPRFDMTPAIALFLTTVIRLEKYRYNYGRKWHLERMEQSTIRLPASASGEPDWAFMENTIKAMPFSTHICDK